MTNLETIRQAAIKANPSILDLKMGCIISYKHYSAIGVAMVLKDIMRGEYLVYVTGSPFVVQQREITEIIGRPITLADVLLAMGMIGDWGFCGVIEEQKELLLEDLRKGKEKPIYWNLLKNLEDQSEETLQFLADLLAEPNTTA